jgi:hypothetical protein
MKYSVFSYISKVSPYCVSPIACETHSLSLYELEPVILEQFRVKASGLLFWKHPHNSGDIPRLSPSGLFAWNILIFS